jgi:hypothetical protein
VPLVWHDLEDVSAHRWWVSLNFDPYSSRKNSEMGQRVSRSRKFKLTHYPRTGGVSFWVNPGKSFGHVVAAMAV